MIFLCHWIILTDQHKACQTVQTINAERSLSRLTSRAKFVLIIVFSSRIHDFRAFPCLYKTNEMYLFADWCTKYFIAAR